MRWTRRRIVNAVRRPALVTSCQLPLPNAVALAVRRLVGLTSRRRANGFSSGSLPDDLCLVAVRPRFESHWYTGEVTADGAAAGRRTAAEPQAAQHRLSVTPV